MSDEKADPPAPGPEQEEPGAASFPASDPPACWTWEVELPAPQQPRTLTSALRSR